MAAGNVNIVEYKKSIKYAIIIILHALVSQPQNHDKGFCYYFVFSAAILW